MPRKPRQPPQRTKWHVYYKLAAKLEWVGEIEAVVRKHCGSDAVVAVGWPSTASGYGGVEVFIESQVENHHLRDAVRSDLPEYMVPRRFHFRDKLPRNPNGKLDRTAISKSLDEKA